jgi:hypothetical protein
MKVPVGKYLYVRARTASARGGWLGIVGDGSSALPSGVVCCEQGLLAVESQLQPQCGD